MLMRSMLTAMGKSHSPYSRGRSTEEASAGTIWRKCLCGRPDPDPSVKVGVWRTVQLLFFFFSTIQPIHINSTKDWPTFSFSFSLSFFSHGYPYPQFYDTSGLIIRVAPVVTLLFYHSMSVFSIIIKQNL